MRLTVLSDVHGDLSRLADAAGLLGTSDVIVVSGDLTRHGDPEELRRVVRELTAIGPDVLAIPGNMDGPGSVQILEAMGVNLHGSSRERDGVRFFGAGASTPTPFGTPFELAEEEIVRLLQEGARMSGSMRCVAVCHNPPHGTAVDRIMIGRHVGGRKIRDFVTQVQPEVFLCGHIHEAAGVDRLGSTVLLNPGPFRRGGVGVVDMPETGEVTAEVVSV